MYVDRAEYLVKLAASLELDVMILMGVSCGTLTAEQALRHVGDKALPEPASQPPAKAVAKRKVVDIDADAAKFAVNSGKLGSGSRGLVLLISDSGACRTELGSKEQPVVAFQDRGFKRRYPRLGRAQPRCGRWARCGTVDPIS